MKIRDVRTYLVGNAWKNWLFVRVETDEGIHGVGEGTLNGFAATVETAMHELRDEYIGLDPRQVELLLQRMVRDVYTDGGQIHMAAVAAIEVACWDIVGKALGSRSTSCSAAACRDRVRVYANGWYRTERDARRPFADRRPARGRRARLHGDEVRSVRRRLAVQDRREEDLSIDIVAAVRDAVGPRRRPDDRGPQPVQRRSTALRIADRLAEFRPAWLEEPVHHPQMGAMVEVARRSPVPIATGESFTSLGQFADLLSPRRRPHPPARAAPPRRALADAPDRGDGRRAPRRRRAAQRAGARSAARSAVQLGACIPNFYVQEIVRRVQRRLDAAGSSIGRSVPVDGYVDVPDRARPRHRARLGARSPPIPTSASTCIRLFSPGWERRDDAPMPAPDPGS